MQCLEEQICALLSFSIENVLRARIAILKGAYHLQMTNVIACVYLSATFTF